MSSFSVSEDVIRPIKVSSARRTFEIPNFKQFQRELASADTSEKMRVIISKFLKDAKAAHDYLEGSSMDFMQRRAHSAALGGVLQEAIGVVEELEQSQKDPLKALVDRIQKLVIKQQTTKVTLLSPRHPLGKPQGKGKTVSFTVILRRTRSHPGVQNKMELELKVDLAYPKEALRKIAKQTQPNTLSRMQFLYRLYEATKERQDNVKKSCDGLRKIQGYIDTMLDQVRGTTLLLAKTQELLESFKTMPLRSKSFEKQCKAWLNLLATRPLVSHVQRKLHRTLVDLRETKITQFTSYQQQLNSWKNRCTLIQQGIVTLFPNITKRMATLDALMKAKVENKEEIVAFIDSRGGLRLGLVWSRQKSTLPEKITQWESLEKALGKQFHPHLDWEKLADDEPSKAVQYIRKHVREMRPDLGERRFFTLAHHFALARDDLSEGIPLIKRDFFVHAFRKLCNNKNKNIHHEFVAAFKVFALEHFLELSTTSDLPAVMKQFGHLGARIKQFVRYYVFSAKEGTHRLKAFNRLADVALQLAYEGEMNTPIAILSGLNGYLAVKNSKKTRESSPYKNLTSFLGVGLSKYEKDLRENPKGPLVIPSVARCSTILAGRLQNVTQTRAELLKNFSQELFVGREVLLYWKKLVCPSGVGPNFIRRIPLADEFALGIYDADRIARITTAITEESARYLLSYEATEVLTSQEAIKKQFAKYWNGLGILLLKEIEIRKKESRANVLVGIGHLALHMKNSGEINGAVALFELLYTGRGRSNYSNEMKDAWGVISHYTRLPFSALLKDFSDIDLQKIFANRGVNRCPVPFLSRLFDDVQKILNPEDCIAHVAKFQKKLRKWLDQSDHSTELPQELRPLFRPKVRRLSLQLIKIGSSEKAGKMSPRRKSRRRSRRRVQSLLSLPEIPISPRSKHRRDVAPKRERPSPKRERHSNRER